jgi:exopolyphosphatase/guanosine-5'-triphosphate,3'-diphosphate pyrophosphatase
VKVRDELMDIKVLREVNSYGLEQWAPVMKAPFPLSAADVSKVIDALRIPAPGSLHDGCSLSALLECLSRADSGVRVVHVHKRRVRYTVEGCMAELSEITANGSWSHARRRVRRYRCDCPSGRCAWADRLRKQTIWRAANVIDGAPERYAVIDVGTNSVKFHIAARDADGSWSTIADRAERPGLAKD